MGRAVLLLAAGLVLVPGCYKGTLISTMSPEQKAQMRREQEEREKYGEAAVHFCAATPTQRKNWIFRVAIGQREDDLVRTYGVPTSRVTLSNSNIMLEWIIRGTYGVSSYYEGSGGGIVRSWEMRRQIEIEAASGLSVAYRRFPPCPDGASSFAAPPTESAPIGVQPGIK